MMTVEANKKAAQWLAAGDFAGVLERGMRAKEALENSGDPSGSPASNRGRSAQEWLTACVTGVRSPHSTRRR